MSLVLTLFIATAIFSFFNVRKKAICFAGDVGVIPLALLLAYIWLELFQQGMNPIWLLLLAVYGVDSFATIVFRLLRKEPLHKPHRHHTYQNLVNEWGWSHLSVAMLYAGSQLIINLAVLLTLDFINPWIMILTILFPLTILYIWVKRVTMSRYTLPFYGK